MNEKEAFQIVNFIQTGNRLCGSNKPIFVGDVLAKWGNLVATKTVDEVSDECSTLCSHWIKLGIDKSLQGILENGIEPEVVALFGFVDNLFPKK
jgi:hypothetical protein